MTYQDIDPEGFTRYGGGCICGAVYTYAGIPEPASFDPDCPLHYSCYSPPRRSLPVTATVTPVAFPLTDPSLAEPRRQPRSAEELCREAHVRHMAVAGQALWLNNALARADQRRADDEALLRREIADGTLRPTKAVRPRPKPRGKRAS